MRRSVPCIALVWAAGCGIGASDTAMSPPVTTEIASSEIGPPAVPSGPPATQLTIPVFYVDPVAPSSLPTPPILNGGGSVDVLGVLLDALLVDLLAPVGPRLNDSMTFLERLCLEGDDPDSFCRRRFGR